MGEGGYPIEVVLDVVSSVVALDGYGLTAATAVMVLSRSGSYLRSISGAGQSAYSNLVRERTRLQGVLRVGAELACCDPLRPSETSTPLAGCSLNNRKEASDTQNCPSDEDFWAQFEVSRPVFVFELAADPPSFPVPPKYTG